jgi:predicted ester cyclase
VKWHGGTLGTVDGLDNVAALVRGFIDALPNLTATEQDIVAEGDTVAVRYVVEATHRGDLLGIPATGRRVRWDAVDVYRVSNGKVVEEWAGDDTLALLVSLGVYTPPWLGEGEDAHRTKRQSRSREGADELDHEAPAEARASAWPLIHSTA